MRELTTYGTITDGELKIHRRDAFIRSMALLSGRVELIIRKVYRRRSTPQNAYYWGVIVGIAAECLSDAAGEAISKEQAHETLKTQCNQIEIINKQTGEMVQIPGTTTQMTTTQAEDYYERCRRWLAEWFGADVPEPNEQTKLDL